MASETERATASPIATSTAPVDDWDEDEPKRAGLPAIWADSFGRVALRSLQVLIVLLVAVAVVYALLQLKVVVLPVVIALILAAAISPLTRWLERRRIPNAIAALISLLLGIGVLLGVLAVVALAVASQWKTLVQKASDGVSQVQQAVAQGGLPVDAKQFESARKAVVAYLTSGAFGSTALSGLSAVGSLLTGLILLIFVLFFFLKDGPMIWRFLLRPLHGHRRARAERIGTASVKVLGGYVRGTALVAMVDTVFIGAGLLILGVPLAVPLAVLVFVTAFIPVVGAVASGIIAALVALVTVGPQAAIIVVVIVLVVNQIEGNILQPLIMGKTLSLHPLVILLALTAGSLLGGIVGAILATPTASVIWTAIKSWRGSDATTEPDPGS